MYSASFSLSTEYREMNNKTVNQKSVVTHATSECSYYHLRTSHFQAHQVDHIFHSAVRESMIMNNWTEFINEFGTHYVKEVIMGGRATQSITYSEKSVAELKAMGIDITQTASARYKAISAST